MVELGDIVSEVVDLGLAVSEVELCIAVSEVLDLGDAEPDVVKLGVAVSEVVELDLAVSDVELGSAVSEVLVLGDAEEPCRWRQHRRHLMVSTSIASFRPSYAYKPWNDSEQIENTMYEATQ